MRISYPALVLAASRRFEDDACPTQTKANSAVAGAAWDLGVRLNDVQARAAVRLLWRAVLRELPRHVSFPL